MEVLENGTDQTVSLRENWREPTAEMPADRSLPRWGPPPGRVWGRRAAWALGGAAVLFILAWVGWMHWGPAWVLRQMATTYGRARSLQVSAALREELNLSPPDQLQTAQETLAHFTFKFAGPNLYSGARGTGREARETVLDGQNAWVQVNGRATVYTCPAPPSLPAKWEQPLGSPVAGAGGACDPLALVMGTASLKGVQRVRFGVDPEEDWLRAQAGPRQAWTISFRQAGRPGRYVVWIRRRDFFLLQAAERTEKDGRVISYDATALGAGLTRDDFSYAPPAGMKVVAEGDVEAVEGAVQGK